MSSATRLGEWESMALGLEAELVKSVVSFDMTARESLAGKSPRFGDSLRVFLNGLGTGRRGGLSMVVGSIWPFVGEERNCRGRKSGAFTGDTERAR
jgi:hypothetical protein